MAVDIRKPLKKMLPHLLKAKDQGLNEADTRVRIFEVFEEVLDYDPLEDISSEVQIAKGAYADLVVKVEGTARFLLEVKAAGTELRDSHIHQAQDYAAKGNIPWVLLSNGVVWNLYHLTFDDRIEYDRAFAIDLSIDDEFDRSAELLGLLHKRSMQKGEIELFWKRRIALHPESIARALFTEETLRLMRRDIRRREKILLDEEEVAHAIRELFSQEIKAHLGPLRITRKRKPKAKGAPDATDAAALSQAANPAQGLTSGGAQPTPSDTKEEQQQPGMAKNRTE